MKRTTVAIILVILVVFVAVVAIFLSQRATPQKYTGSHAQVTVGTSLFDMSGLIWIAEDRGYFTENGLDVRLKFVESGKQAVDGLLGGEVDVATAAEFVLVGKAMNEAKLQAIGSIAKSEVVYLITGKDKGISQVSDLKGKRIGLARQTSSEFYIGRYLQLHGIGLQDVNLVDLNPLEIGESLINGKVDAIVTWDPYAYAIEKGLGRNAVIWPLQSGQMVYWLVMAMREYVAEHPALIDRLLGSLNQAEQFAVNNPDKAKKIVQIKLKADEAYIERIWPKIRLTLSFDQGLIIAMEDESRWMIDNKLTSNRKMPYYPDYIYWQGLKKVKPSSVTLIH